MYKSRNFYEVQASMIMDKLVEQRRVLNYTDDVLVKIDIMSRIKQLESELEFYVNQLRNM